MSHAGPVGFADAHLLTGCGTGRDPRSLWWF